MVITPFIKWEAGSNTTVTLIEQSHVNATTVVKIIVEQDINAPAEKFLFCHVNKIIVSMSMLGFSHRAIITLFIYCFITFCHGIPASLLTNNINILLDFNTFHSFYAHTCHMRYLCTRSV